MKNELKQEVITWTINKEGEYVFETKGKTVNGMLLSGFINRNIDIDEKTGIPYLELSKDYYGFCKNYKRVTLVQGSKMEVNIHYTVNNCTGEVTYECKDLPKYFDIDSVVDSVIDYDDGGYPYLTKGHKFLKINLLNSDVESEKMV